jgi:hypothetical protein
MQAFAEWAGVERDVADAAIENLRNGEVSALLGSGAQGSGKDSVCPEVLHRLGITDAVQCRVAHAIRAEMNDILQIITGSDDPDTSVDAIIAEMGVPDDAAELYTSLFFEATRDPQHVINVFERSERMRRALQWHGAEGRSHQPGYWVKKTYQAVIPHLAEKHSVYLTDGRFPAEVDAGRTMGVFCIRLWVPEDVRIERIMQRDGFVPSMATLRHPGETALDGYWGIDAEIDNTAEIENVISAICDEFLDHQAAMRRID